MHDEIIAHLRENPTGVTSKEIAESFLKFKNADPKIAHMTVNSILSRDRRCLFGDDNLWHAVKIAESTADSLLTSDLAVINIVMDPDKTRPRILHCSVWTINSQVQCRISAWLINPEELPFEEREVMVDSADAQFSGNNEDTFALIARQLNKRIPVLVSSSGYMQLFRACAQAGHFLSDDFITAKELFTAAELPAPRPFTTESICSSLLMQRSTGTSFYHQGELFAQSIPILLQSAREHGVESRSDLDSSEAEIVRPQFEGKNFTYDQIVQTTEQPGVYAFKNAADEYLYIGKAKNLKRRLLTYFRDTEESPEKIERLRKESQNIITHQCGSELESLIVEYRLIKKYAPLLNKKIEVAERKGTFTPINDCIVLLPNVEKGKGMSFWFRRNQKIVMKSFDVTFTAPDTFISELSSFFFTDKLTAEPTDFPEQEIVHRWIRNNQDSLVIVPVSRMADAQEIFEGIKSYWKEVSV